MNLQTLLYFVYSIWFYQMCEHESSSTTHEHVNLATLSFIHFFCTKNVAMDSRVREIRAGLFGHSTAAHRVSIKKINTLCCVCSYMFIPNLLK